MRFFRPVPRVVEPEAARPEARDLPTRADQGNWYPACGGTETEFRSRGGHRLLYCWQPATGRHAYINLDTDIVLTDDEARATLMTW